jgi:hypothetical protein
MDFASHFMHTLDVRLRLVGVGTAEVSDVVTRCDMSKEVPTSKLAAGIER